MSVIFGHVESSSPLCRTSLCVYLCVYCIYNHLSLSLILSSSFLLHSVIEWFISLVSFSVNEAVLEEREEELVNRLLLSSVCTVKSYLPWLVLLTGDVIASQSAGGAAVGTGCRGSLGYMHRDALATRLFLSPHHYWGWMEGEREREKCRETERWAERGRVKERQHQ